MVKKVGKYELGKTIGEGTFGKVKEACNKDNGERVAVKVLDKEKLVKHGMSEQIKKEITIMKLIQHKHIVNMKDVLVSKTKIYIVLELVTGGELFYKLAKEGRFSEDMARMYFQQLISGVEYCHSQGVFHRDLKPENLLLDEQGTLKLSDFGLSATYGQDKDFLLHTTCGTPNYVAPEVLDNAEGYDGALADTWSCGVILFVFLAGFLPFDEPTQNLLFRKIKRAEFKFPNWFTSDAKELISKILVADPSKRFSIAQIKQHHWFKENIQTPIIVPPPSPPRSPTPDTDTAFENIEDDDEEETDAEDFPTVNGQKITNAFDLISMSGAFDLSPMLLAKDEARVNTFTSFTSEQQPALILKRLEEVMSKMPLGIKVLDKAHKIQVTATSSTGIITFTVQILLLAPNLYMVDFTKGRGEILEFCNLFKQIRDSCSDLISKEDQKQTNA